MKLVNFKLLVVVSLAFSIISGCGSQYDQNMIIPSDNFIAQDAGPQKNYLPVKPGEGELYDFYWAIDGGSDKSSLQKNLKNFETFMADHVTKEDIANYRVEEPVLITGKGAGLYGYYKIVVKLFGVNKSLIKIMSSDLEKYLGYDRGGPEDKRFRLYDNRDNRIGPNTGIFSRRW